jgi:hypothetical protein
MPATNVSTAPIRIIRRLVGVRFMVVNFRLLEAKEQWAGRVVAEHSGWAL